jgi:hypothetical protein
MYVRMYACMNVCMYACVRACMHVYMYVCMHACMYVRTYVCIHVCMYVCVMCAWVICARALACLYWHCIKIPLRYSVKVYSVVCCARWVAYIYIRLLGTWTAKWNQMPSLCFAWMWISKRGDNSKKYSKCLLCEFISYFNFCNYKNYQNEVGERKDLDWDGWTM